MHLLCNEKRQAWQPVFNSCYIYEPSIPYFYCKMLPMKVNEAPFCFVNLLGETQCGCLLNASLSNFCPGQANCQLGKCAKDVDRYTLTRNHLGDRVSGGVAQQLNTDSGSVQLQLTVCTLEQKIQSYGHKMCRGGEQKLENCRIICLQ